MRYLYNNVDITDKPFKDVDGTSYPSNWCRLATQEDLERVGIVCEEVVETIDLESIYNRANQRINNFRLEANTSYFEYQGKQIACDELSRSDIDAANGIISLTGSLPPNWVGAWKAIDNTFVPLTTLNDWIAFYASMVQQGIVNFNRSQTLKAELNSIYNSNVSDADKKLLMESLTWESQ